MIRTPSIEISAGAATAGPPRRIIPNSPLLNHSLPVPERARKEGEESVNPQKDDDKGFRLRRA